MIVMQKRNGLRSGRFSVDDKLMEQEYDDVIDMLKNAVYLKLDLINIIKKSAEIYAKYKSMMNNSTKESYGIELILEALEIKSPKTKEMIDLLKTLNIVDKKVLFFT